MELALGLSELPRRDMYTFLTSIGQERELAAPPLVVLRQHVSSKVKRRYESAGFAVKIVSSAKEADDESIRQRIRSADASKIKEIILVSSDSGYYPYLLEKLYAGVRVYIVATRRESNLIPVKLSSKFPSHEAQGFQFVELATIAESLGISLAQPGASVLRNPNRKRVVLEFDSTEIPATLAALEAVNIVLESFPENTKAWIEE